MIIPTHTVLKKSQINVGKDEIFKVIDNFTAPRLAEYYDNPCPKPRPKKPRLVAKRIKLAVKKTPKNGVTVIDKFTKGEYDIVILSAKESRGLSIWLKQNGYSIPKGAEKALAPYIKQNMKFFAAKVNLEELGKKGITKLSPIQMAFESKKFMLPIRLGMINSSGLQDLIVYFLTKKGRVESTNYTNVKVPTDVEIPTYVKKEFGTVYKSIFQKAWSKNKKAVFTEYFWDTSWCDPCVGTPPNYEQLKQMGVFWLKDNNPNNHPKVTRLHVRYGSSTFPQDLFFQETSDSAPFQARYVIRHPWDGDADECSASKSYFARLNTEKAKRAQNLAKLTDWDIKKISNKMGIKATKNEDKWYDNILEIKI